MKKPYKDRTLWEKIISNWNAEWVCVWNTNFSQYYREVGFYTGIKSGIKKETGSVSILECTDLDMIRISLRGPGYNSSEIYRAEREFKKLYPGRKADTPYLYYMCRAIKMLLFFAGIFGILFILSFIAENLS